MSVQSTSHFLDLPPAWLALLFQHIASGPGGLSSAAAFSQTCKFLHSLSEGSAVIYRNLVLSAAISSPDHPAWPWLARRSGRIAGLGLALRLELLGDDATEDADQLPDWLQPLQTLSGILGVELRVEWVGVIADMDHPYIALLLKEHGQLISHLTIEVDVSEDGLKLRRFCEAAAPCRSMDLTLRHLSDQVLDLADLGPVAGSLQVFKCHSSFGGDGGLRGAGALNSMSQLTALHLSYVDIQTEELWGMLAKLRSLQELILLLRASGDPSPLSALTGLSSLALESCPVAVDDQVPFTFSSLQPISTLRHLEALNLCGHACAATSLQGLAGLSDLKVLSLEAYVYEGGLRSLEGVGAGVTQLSIGRAPDLVSLAGIEACTSLERLSLNDCGISFSQPVRGLNSLKHLEVSNCSLTSLECFASMPLESLRLECCSSLTQLSGVEHFTALRSLEVNSCDCVTSLQPLSQLGRGLQKLRVDQCKGVQEEVLQLPHVQPTADVYVVFSKVKEVVLAGGVRRACIDGIESSEDLDLE
jgi:Leucine-rich repeat (LRR) protein